MCRGNYRSAWFSSGGYDFVAEAVFSGLQADGFFLEYDDERSGTFEPLRFVPRDKVVVLGLVTTKTPALESRDDLKRRVEAAARYVDADRLCLSPQCGFASTVDGNALTLDQQRAKLDLIVQTAADLWGSQAASAGRLAGGELDARDAGYDSGARRACEHGVDVGQRTDRRGFPRRLGEVARGHHLGEHRSGGELRSVLAEQGVGIGHGDGVSAQGHDDSHDHPHMRASYPTAASLGMDQRFLVRNSLPIPADIKHVYLASFLAPSRRYLKIT
jgi:hypothetical protein